MTNGTYIEKLDCGGELRVTLYEWKLHFYFSGPDHRYNGTIVEIPGRLIDEYISAWKENWETYQQLKTAIPAQDKFQKQGKALMTIFVRGFRDGVCLRNHHLCVSSEEQLEMVVACFARARERAPQIQELLRTLGS